MVALTDKTTDWAAGQSFSLLAPLEKRWRHTKGVVERARDLSAIFNKEDQSTLISSAYLHDIGYAPSLHRTGFHPLDGAFYLQSQGQNRLASLRLASLVAYHSESPFEARLRALMPVLSKFHRETSLVADALTYCDMTTNSEGTQVSFQERIDEIFSRYDEAHIVHQAIQQAIPLLSLTIERVERVLHEKSK